RSFAARLPRIICVMAAATPPADTAPTGISARVVRQAGHIAHLLGRVCVQSGLHSDGVRGGEISTGILRISAATVEQEPPDGGILGQPDGAIAGLDGLFRPA